MILFLIKYKYTHSHSQEVQRRKETYIIFRWDAPLTIVQINDAILIIIHTLCIYRSHFFQQSANRPLVVWASGFFSIVAYQTPTVSLILSLSKHAIFVTSQSQNKRNESMPNNFVYVINWYLLQIRVINDKCFAFFFFNSMLQQCNVIGFWLYDPLILVEIQFAHHVFWQSCNKKCWISYFLIKIVDAEIVLVFDFWYRICWTNIWKSW